MMYYTVESTLMIGAKRFESDEGAEILDLAHKEGISKIWKNIFEEIIF